MTVLTLVSFRSAVESELPLMDDYVQNYRVHIVDNLIESEDILRPE